MLPVATLEPCVFVLAVAVHWSLLAATYRVVKFLLDRLGDCGGHFLLAVLVGLALWGLV